MTSKIIQPDPPKPAEVKYPQLLKMDSGGVVLMTSHGIGVVVVGSAYNPLGEYSERWAVPQCFDEYDPTLTVQLSNAD